MVISPSRTVLRPVLLTAFYLFCPNLFCAKPAAAAEDYAAWPNATDVILNTSATGAGVAGTVANFPVLVRLTSANFPFSQAGGKGRDIRFSKQDRTPLDYEIERWDSTRAQAEIWVRLDEVRGNAAGQIVRMYWGNPSAADSSDAAAVFRGADGYVAAWHLGVPGTAARPNAVAGGNPAAPNSYDGDENSAGLIAGADSLDGTATGDFLDIGDGYTEFTAGFTYSAWVYPTAMKRWSHVLDLGNGTGNDNIIVNRVDTTAAMGFHNWTGTNSYAKEVPNQWALNQWQFITVTMTGKNVRMYKNGAQILADTLPGAMTGVNRTTNYLGKSNWAADDFFQGKLDEPVLAKTVRSADWIKLSYQNQRAAQTLVTVVKPVQCAARISVPPDTTVPEGGSLTLNAGVECAAGFSWSVISGPAPRILDPETKSLAVAIPRVAADTVIVYRLTAEFSDSTRTRDVRVRIKESIPDPIFTLPAIPSWSGKEAIAYRPAISNLAAIKASRDSALHWTWSFAGPAVDTSWLEDGMTLKSAEGAGALQIGLCLDNGGPIVCRNAALTITGSAASMLQAQSTPQGQITKTDPGRDALGRAADGPITPRKAGRPGIARYPRK
ncbi:MAG: hypothetical protein JWP91_3156 [Fibrobacteres bacterium]|nr:hypothetical protein [Fibrobacterota bacterium]